MMSSEGSQFLTVVLLQLLQHGRYDVKLDSAEWDRLATWMDTLGQIAGHFSRQQKDHLRRMKEGVIALVERP
jgi:hypothetical protein